MPGPVFFSSVVWIVLENRGFAQVKDLASSRFLEQHGAVLDQYYALTHPSGPNYRLIAGGRKFSPYEVFVRKEPSIASEYASLELPTIDWWPGGLMKDSTYDGVPALKHDPFPELYGIADPAADAGRQTGIKLFSIWKKPFAPDLLPGHCQVYLGFDNDNEAHDPFPDDSQAKALQTADRNLMSVLATLRHSRWFNTPDQYGRFPVFIETWDESFLGDQRVFTAFYGRGVKAGYVSQVHYDHLSLSRTLTDNWHLPPLGGAEQAHDIADVWKPASPSKKPIDTRRGRDQK